MKRKADSEGGAGSKRSNLKAGKPRMYARPGPSMRAPPVPRPGFQRTAGLYGRFNKSGSRPPQAELKFLDTALSFSDDFTFGIENSCLNVIPQDATASGRIGRRVVIKSIQIRGYNYFVPTTTATASALVNMYLVLDTQANGSPPAATDLFESTQLTTSMLNLSNSNRFRILKRWVVAFNSNAGATTAYNNVVKPLEFSMKCNIPLEFSGTTGVTAEVRSNNLCIIAGAVLQDDKVSFAGTCRLRFVG